MKPLFSILLALSLAFGVSPICAQAEYGPTVAQDVVAPYRALCMITTSKGQGSGTLIATNDKGQGLVLTCRHVAQYVDNPVMCTFYWAGGGHETNGVVIAVEQGDRFNNDLALVAISSAPAGVEPRKVASFDKADGPWVGAGFRAGIMRVTVPVLTSTEMADGRIMFPTPLVQGMSGGAFFNKYGEVVGVTVGSDLKTIGIAADGMYLRRLVGQYIQEKQGE